MRHGTAGKEGEKGKTSKCHTYPSAEQTTNSHIHPAPAPALLLFLLLPGLDVRALVRGLALCICARDVSPAVGGEDGPHVGGFVDREGCKGGLSTRSDSHFA